jgi:hypothetical protein
MIKNKNEKSGPIEIDLTGPDGNAFVLLGIASRLARKLGKDKAKIQADMTSGDYENLLSVMEREFGDYIVMYR